MELFNLFSLRNRFLIAPFIGVVLTLILYFASNAILQSNSKILKQLSESNLPQVSEISRITVLLINNHSELTSLLLSTLEDPDEERVYVKGRKILNELHLIETHLKLKISSAKKLVIDDVDIFKQIELKFTYYREAIISAIELSTLDAKRAKKELVIADNVLHQLNSMFLVLSDYHVRDLTEKADLVEGSLDDYEIVAVLAIVLIIIMISSALYFSNHMSASLDRINQALIKLSREDVDIDLPEKNDKYLDQLTKAVHKFKSTLEKNKEQRESLKQAVGQLKDSNERYFNLLDIAATAIIVIDNKQSIVLFNKAAERVFGYDSHEILGKSMEKLIPEKYRHKHNTQVNEFVGSDTKYLSAISRQPVSALTKTGEEIQIEASVAKLKLAEETLMTVTITDITQRLKAEERILQQAHFDALTNLPNRFLSLDRLSQLLIDTKRNNERVAVLFLDLDDFKKINDSMGHEMGDKLLIEAAERLRTAVRSGDTVGRLGGDEFLIMLPGIVDASDASPVIDSLLEQFRSAFKVDDRELMITASIGISIFPEDGANASELLRNADSAMYHAKDLGRNTYSYFTETMNEKVSRRLALEEQMHGALLRGEFRLLYQPQIDVSSGRVAGVEALLRWNNPVLGDVMPDEFIPVAEQSGLIVSIGEFVLSESLNMAFKWQQVCKPSFRIAVNLSPIQFRDPRLVDFIEQTLSQSGVAAESLELEITEGVLMSGHSFIVDALEALAKLGVGLAMDDFGTGYSSMSYLREYQFDSLKIDRSFVRDITDDKADRELVNATIAMAHALGLKVVAEGVETKAQLEYLASLGCELAQGYYFSMPVTSDEISEMLEKQG